MFFFFGTFIFFFFFVFFNKTMDQAIDGKDKHILKFIGVLTQFCLLSALKKQKNNNATPHTTNETNETNDTNETNRQDKQHKTIDKLIKGLGVSLAKTPLEVLLTNKTDDPR